MITTQEDWERVSHAVAAVREGLTRIDGAGFKVYRVPGNIIRIDLPNQPIEQEDQNGNGS